MKRFTETEKWRDPWFMALPINSKVLFLYLADNCNNAGFVEDNPRLICFHIGMNEADYEGALKGLGRGIKGACGWLWIRRFLRHQKNEPLNPVNPAHKQIIRLILDQLGRFDGMPEFQEFIAPYEGLRRPTVASSSLQGATKGLLSPIGTGTGTGTKKKRGSTEGEKKQKAVSFPNGLPDSEWLETLYHDPTYADIDVKREYGKMVNWCKIRKATPTRRRFINWLNRAEKPMTAAGREQETKWKDIT